MYNEITKETEAEMVESLTKIAQAGYEHEKALIKREAELDDGYIKTASSNLTILESTGDEDLDKLASEWEQSGRTYARNEALGTEDESGTDDDSTEKIAEELAAVLQDVMVLGYNDETEKIASEVTNGDDHISKVASYDRICEATGNEEVDEAAAEYESYGRQYARDEFQAELEKEAGIISNALKYKKFGISGATRSFKTGLPGLKAAVKNVAGKKYQAVKGAVKENYAKTVAALKKGKNSASDAINLKKLEKLRLDQGSIRANKSGLTDQISGAKALRAKVKEVAIKGAKGTAAVGAIGGTGYMAGKHLNKKAEDRDAAINAAKIKIIEELMKDAE